MSKGILTCSLLLVVVASWSQSLTTFSSKHKLYVEMMSIQPKKNFKSEVQTVIYSDAKKSSIVKSDLGTITAGDSGYIQYLSANSWFVQTPEVALSLDKSIKKCFITAPRDIQNLTPGGNMAILDSVQYSIQMNENADSWTFQVKEKVKLSDIENVTVIFDKKTKLIKQIEMTFWSSNYLSEEQNDQTVENPFWVMTYKTTTGNAYSEAVIKSFNEVLQRNEKGYTLMSAYAEYTLTDLRINLNH